jgi:long-chain fatty acid transport protein
MIRGRSALPLCAVALCGSAWTQPAFASGFSTARFGGEQGHPATDNATAIYYNPAGIAESEGFHVFVDGSLALRATSYTHASTGTPQEDVSVAGANDGEATLFNFAAAPMIGASAKLGNFAVGAGFYVPFGGAASWDKNEAFEGSQQYAGPVDGVQRWFGIDGSVQSAYFTLAAAYKIPQARLSLGVSGNLVRSQAHTVRGVAIDSSGQNTLATEGRALLDVSGFQGSFGVGALFEALPKQLWIGASYQSRPNVAGGMKLDGTLKLNLAGSVVNNDVELHQDLPDIVRLGARYKPTPVMELRLFGDFSRWSALQDQCVALKGDECEIAENGAEEPGTSRPIVNIARRWEDAFAVRAGASYWPIPAAEVFAGLGYDGNAIPDETLEPSLTDFHDVSVALGGRFAITKQLHLAAAYTHIFYIGRDTTGDSTLNALENPSKVPDSGGDYQQTIGVLNVNLDFAF